MTQSAPWNFIIQYQSREGSSAIINLLSRQNGVRVPVFEELDPYLYQTHHDNSALLSILSGVLNTGTYPHSSRHPNAIAPIDDSDVFQSVGFKWRLFGSRFRLARLFKRFRVKLFILTRRDFAEHVASTYFHLVASNMETDKKIGSFPQFATLSATDTHDELRRKSYSDITVPLDRRKLFGSAIRRLRLKWRQANSSLIFKLYKVPVHQIYYEDFRDNPVQFLQDFMAEIGVEPTESLETESDFKRVFSNRHQDRIENSADAFGAWWFRALDRFHTFCRWRIDHF